MIDPIILQKARETFKRRCSEIGEAQALKELDASFNRTLAALTGLAHEQSPTMRLIAELAADLARDCPLRQLLGAVSKT